MICKNVLEYARLANYSNLFQLNMFFHIRAVCPSNCLTFFLSLCGFSFSFIPFYFSLTHTSFSLTLLLINVHNFRSLSSFFRAIEETATGSHDRPVEDVIITDCGVVPKELDGEVEKL